VTTAKDVAAYGQVMSAARATTGGMPSDVMPALLSRLETLHAPHIVAFLARLDGTPVGRSLTVVVHGVAGVYWVGTTPEPRCRVHNLPEWPTPRRHRVLDMGASLL
jgi:hypothetical protein